MIYLTKKVSFSAAHRLTNPELNSDENKKIFDKCSNYYGHGHNYQLEVTVKGLPDPKAGWLIDLKLLKSILNKEIVEKVDHKHLNFDVPFMSGIIPTVENLIVRFWELLKDKLPGVELHKLRLYETETSYADYFGDEIEIKKY